ncbi:MAG: 4Fe-4S dicluster domain-containing protein [Flavobacteriales bacterium]
MKIFSSILFIALLILGLGFFAKNIQKLVRNILLGKDVDRTDNAFKRWLTMTRVALGQGKMTVRPISGILHIIVYLGFIVINIELLEIIIDGIFGTHRIFSFMEGFYDFLIASFEFLAFLVIVSVVIFWIRRNIVKVKRFWNSEMQGFPKNDANYILYIEFILMALFLIMNAADYKLQSLGVYQEAGHFPISQYVANTLPDSITVLEIIERTAWWLHIIGILFFMNYLYYSKHLHILLAFPNTYYSKLEPRGKLTNLTSVTKEVKMMMNPNVDPFAPPLDLEDENTEKFGASDANDLSWIQLMNAYTCTECGRCTSVCPASITGKKLSPRKIMMDTRDRIEEIGKNIDQNGTFIPDNKSLLGTYISHEELWACTSCNACVDACPVLIDPLSIIIDLRRYLVMEQSAAPQELNAMMTNIENNSAPWKFGQSDRLNWK